MFLCGCYALVLLSRLFCEVDLSVCHVIAGSLISGFSVLAIVGSAYGYLEILVLVCVLCLLLPCLVSWSYSGWSGFSSMDSSGYGSSGLAEYSCGLVRTGRIAVF